MAKDVQSMILNPKVTNLGNLGVALVQAARKEKS
jgi:hypothetical protein